MFDFSQVPEFVVALIWLVRSGGFNECGEDLVRDVWIIIAEDKRGGRVRHFHSFDTEEGGEAFAEKVKASGRKLDPEHWGHTDPCYGSEAYQSPDAAYARHEEAQIEHDNEERGIHDGPTYVGFSYR